ncbi:MFS transporter [Shimia sp. SDUM112013]|uniref:MFS transporter n=1 Tax=Shimia sp. SDUM112013 TaxID=3136160 RepID=UPI0032ECD854
MVKARFALYLRYCAGNSVALTCIWMQRVAVLWLAWELSESTFWSSIVLTAQLVPTVIIGPLFGAVADRVRVIPAMVTVQLVLAALTTSLVALALADLVTVGVLIGFECLIGITVSAHQPLRMTLVPALVPKTLLPRAIALDSMVFNLTRMIGPALAGLLIVIIGVPPVLLLGALGNLVLAMVIWSLRNDVSKPSASSGNLLSQLHNGWTVICDSHRVTKAFMLTGVFGMGGRAAIDLFPLFAATTFGREADGAGLLLSAAGFGAVCAAAFMALSKNLPNHIAEYLGITGFAALFLMSQTESWLLGLACAGTLGCAASIVGVANQSKIQLSIPDGFHGRVMGLWVLVGLGSTALGTAAYGTISDLTNLRDASAILSVIGILSIGAISLKNGE